MLPNHNQFLNIPLPSFIHRHKTADKQTFKSTDKQQPNIKSSNRLQLDNHLNTITQPTSKLNTQNNKCPSFILKKSDQSKNNQMSHSAPSQNQSHYHPTSDHKKSHQKLFTAIINTKQPPSKNNKKLLDTNIDIQYSKTPSSNKFQEMQNNKIEKLHPSHQVTNYYTKNNLYPNVKQPSIQINPQNQNAPKHYQAYNYPNIKILTQKNKLKIQNFSILQKLGKGSFGEIFLVKQKKTGFLCVIKKISKKKIQSNNILYQILRQIKIQSYLKHPNIVSLYGFFDDDSYLYLIIQYMPDGDLMKFISNSLNRTQQIISNIVRQICQGVKYMHNQNIIHRDIKPQNIFVFGNSIKIGDMGCSVQYRLQRKTVVGSIFYMSPEQLIQSAYDQKIDSWSIGVLTYQFFYGVPPFQKDIMEICRHQKQPKLSQLVFQQSINLSVQAKDFITRLLKPKPKDRMSCKESLKHLFITKYINLSEQQYDI